MSDQNADTPGETDVFTDTCVLFDYAVEEREAATTLFETYPGIDEVVSQRVKREFESVASRHQDVHRELLEVATEGDLAAYQAAELGSQSNDIGYVVDIYNKLLTLNDDAEVIRRVNELINRLNKARRELFGDDGIVVVLDLDGLDARLKGALDPLIDNDADVRIVCDAVKWRRNGGSGTFLTADADDLLGDGDSDTDSGSTSSDSVEDDASGGLSDSFEDFLAAEEKSLPERINDRIASRFNAGATLTILSVPELLTGLEAEPPLD